MFNASYKYDARSSFWSARISRNDVNMLYKSYEVTVAGHTLYRYRGLPVVQHHSTNCSIETSSLISVAVGLID